MHCHVFPIRWEAKSLIGIHPEQPTISKPLHIRSLPMLRPKINYDPITGDAIKWNTWHGLFTTMIDKQPLPTGEKKWRLQTLSTGKDNEATAWFYCNPDWYQSTMRLRYGWPDIIVSNYFAPLPTQIPPSTHHKDSFMKLSTVLNNLVATFQYQGFHQDLQSTVNVLSHLPNFNITKNYKGHEMSSRTKSISLTLSFSTPR